MADITDVHPENLRALAGTLVAKDQILDGRTPAGALTTLAQALRGSLIDASHNGVSLDFLNIQEQVVTHTNSEVRALNEGAEIIQNADQDNAAAMCVMEPPR